MMDNVSRRKFLTAMGAVGAASLLAVPGRVFSNGLPNAPSPESPGMQGFLDVSSYVTGNGTADDTAGFQAAVDMAYFQKKTVYIPPGMNIRIRNTILLNKQASFYSFVNKRSRLERIFQDASVINFETQIAFRSKDPDKTCYLDMVGLRLERRYEPPVNAFSGEKDDAVVLFDDIRFLSSYIAFNQTFDWDIVFRGTFSQNSWVENNFFLSTRRYFLTSNSKILAKDATLSDTVISHNYLNVHPSNLAVCCFHLNAPVNNVIETNFVDSFKHTIDIYAGVARNMRVALNSFHNSYRGIRGTFSTSTFLGNHFQELSYAPSLERTANADKEMKSKPWIGIELLDDSKDTSISGNTVSGCDVFLRLHGNNYQQIVTGQNVYTRTKTRVEVDYYNASDKPANDTFIDELMYKRFETLPPANLTGEHIQSFDRHIIRYRDKTILNDGGTWKDMMGNTVEKE